MSTTTNLGRVGLILCGDYDPVVKYTRLSIVSYQGSAYAAKQDAQGVPPTDAKYWQPMTDIHTTLNAADTAVNDANTAASAANAAAAAANTAAANAEALRLKMVDGKLCVEVSQ